MSAKRQTLGFSAAGGSKLSARLGEAEGFGLRKEFGNSRAVSSGTVEALTSWISVVATGGSVLGRPAAPLFVGDCGLWHRHPLEARKPATQQHHLVNTLVGACRLEVSRFKVVDGEEVRGDDRMEFLPPAHTGPVTQRQARIFDAPHQRFCQIGKHCWTRRRPASNRLALAACVLWCG